MRDDRSGGGASMMRRDQSLFEVEHVIDEFFTQKPNGSLEN